MAQSRHGGRVRGRGRVVRLPRHALLNALASFLERWASHDIAWLSGPVEQVRPGMADAAARDASIDPPASEPRCRPERTSQTSN